MFDTNYTTYDEMLDSEIDAMEQEMEIRSEYETDCGDWY